MMLQYKGAQWGACTGSELHNRIRASKSKFHNSAKCSPCTFHEDFCTYRLLSAAAHRGLKVVYIWCERCASRFPLAAVLDLILSVFKVAEAALTLSQWQCYWFELRVASRKGKGLANCWDGKGNLRNNDSLSLERTARIKH